MHDDPLRTQSLSLVSGCVLATIAVAACAILAFIRPQGSLGSAPIVMARDSGALYARIGDVLHPVPNLASARIIAGSAANPVVVAATTIASVKRGPAMGIPGAPAAIGTPLTPPAASWSPRAAKAPPPPTCSTTVAAPRWTSATRPWFVPFASKALPPCPFRGPCSTPFPRFPPSPLRPSTAQAARDPGRWTEFLSAPSFG